MERIFQCVNSQSYMCGPKGEVQYESADGSVFAIQFDCPTSSPNIYSTSVSSGSPWKITGTVPTHGYYINYDCTITQKEFDAIIDIPVPLLDILNAPKCDLISVRQILRYADGRDKFLLKNVFEIQDLPPSAKLWRAKDLLFLTPQGKASLARLFAQKIAKEMPTETKKTDKLLEDAIAFNENTAKGDIAKSACNSLNSTLQSEFADSASLYSQQMACIIKALLNCDLSQGWSDMVNAYIRRDVPEGLKEREKKLVNFIEEKIS